MGTETAKKPAASRAKKSSTAIKATENCPEKHVVFVVCRQGHYSTSLRGILSVLGPSKEGLAFLESKGIAFFHVPVSERELFWNYCANKDYSIIELVPADPGKKGISTTFTSGFETFKEKTRAQEARLAAAKAERDAAMAKRQQAEQERLAKIKEEAEAKKLMEAKQLLGNKGFVINPPQNSRN